MAPTNRLEGKRRQVALVLLILDIKCPNDLLDYLRERNLLGKMAVSRRLRRASLFDSQFHYPFPPFHQFFP